ncbi:hypothetical protein NC652_019048 [Populus alba x Populus x berolinensis]|nr:hypothetical protein NC652_019048 [Populus alba x Populus x berolinensis]
MRHRQERVLNKFRAFKKLERETRERSSLPSRISFSLRYGDDCNLASVTCSNLNLDFFDPSFLMAKNKKKTTSSRRSPVRTRQHIQADIPDKMRSLLRRRPISPSTADHVLVEDCSDCDAFEEDEVDYSNF